MKDIDYFYSKGEGFVRKGGISTLCVYYKCTICDTTRRTKLEIKLHLRMKHRKRMKAVLDRALRLSGGGVIFSSEDEEQ